MKEKFIKYGTMTSYLLLYVIVAIVSLISSIHFFNLAHQGWMSVVLACSFELGQMACLFGALTRHKKGFDIVWIMFVLLTLFQCMANTYAAYVGLGDYISWSELFGLNEMSVLDQKRIIAGISGAILPLIALGFIKCLTDYIDEDVVNKGDDKIENIMEQKPMVEKKTEKKEEPKVYDGVVINDDVNDDKKPAPAAEAKRNMENALYKLKEVSNGKNL